MLTDGPRVACVGGSPMLKTWGPRLHVSISKLGTVVLASAFGAAIYTIKLLQTPNAVDFREVALHMLIKQGMQSAKAALGGVRLQIPLVPLFCCVPGCRESIYQGWRR